MKKNIKTTSFANSSLLNFREQPENKTSLKVHFTQLNH